MSEGPSNRISLSEYLFNPQDRSKLPSIPLPSSHQGVRIPKYKSPDSTPDQTPVKGRPMVNGFSIPTKQPQMDVHTLGLLEKLHKRDMEFLELKSAKERLETELEILKEQSEQQKHLNNVLKQEKVHKDQQIAFLREQITKQEQYYKSRMEKPTKTWNALPEYQALVKDLQTVECLFNGILEENNELKDELASLSAFKDVLNRTQRETTKVRSQLSKLRIMLDSIKNGSDMDFKMLLAGTDVLTHSSPEQMASDFRVMNEDLKHIHLMITDFHAEQSGNSACIQQ